MTLLIVIPTLNEARHIDGVLGTVAAFAEAQAALVVVADGGSTDGTQERVRARAAQVPWLRLHDNPDRLQSAAINRAVEAFGEGRTLLLRLDAHAGYPPEFLDVLITEQAETGAASVVVSMVAIGQDPVQRIVALAQNSPFGNGASPHRNLGEGRWVDHGHHALFRLDAFREVGGYDPTFSHNEDAELDHRLTEAGHRIWLTARTHLDYFPRASLSGLARQYFNFGKGRARNLAKHAKRPATRQAIVAALAPAVLLCVLTPLHPVFALPLILWIIGCALAGLLIWRQSGEARGLLAGPVAGVMQLAWSFGFWAQKMAPARAHAVGSRS